LCMRVPWPLVCIAQVPDCLRILLSLQNG
jgi:hypothetical protein